jgi:small subunit ribosomal protein S17
VPDPNDPPPSIPSPPNNPDPGSPGGWEEPTKGPGTREPRGHSGSRRDQRGAVKELRARESRTVERASHRKTRVGIVVSDKMHKTVVVYVEQRAKHGLYGKVITRSAKLHAHDEDGTSRVGDRVRVMETRPMSKTKRWRVVEIIERAK